MDLHNEDNENEEASSQNVHKSSLPTGKKVKGAESDSDLDWEYKPPVRK